MSIFIRALCFLCITLFVSFDAITFAKEKGKSTAETENQLNETVHEESSDSYPDPNTIPYRSKKSIAQHVLSIPAKVWRLAWTPLGETVIWVEQNRIHKKAIDFFYLNDERSAALFPLVSLGGNTGAGGGAMAFHNNLFGKQKQLFAQFLYSSTRSNSATITYKDSSFFGSSFYIDVTGSYFNDADENLYISSNVSPEDLDESSIGANNSVKDDETSYATEELGIFSNLNYVINDEIGLGIETSFRRTDIDSGDGRGGDSFPEIIQGSDDATLFSVGGTMTFNFSNGWPRILSGSVFKLGYSYNNEVGDSRYGYNRLKVEAQQFIPIPFLTTNRRIAVRGVYERLNRHGSRQIPFYELSMLGDASNLRGFDQNRYRGRGSLLFNFEYRYPVWDTWDAVIFVDEGQVFDESDKLDIANFHTAIGAGIRFMSQAGFLMRFEIAKSSEQWRALFQITPNF